ncbi:MAG: RelA/SpoT family protein [Neisseriaceae bacterium]|nr:MAG: RelA/SpoT family protein [Neisseriaceae bacterium]
MPALLADYDEVTLKSLNILFNEVSYLNDEEKNRLGEACAFAHQAHHGQYRKSGEPYITHPITVATEIATWGEDVTTLMAAVLHDVIEDTDTSFSELESFFGVEVAQVVDGVSKLEKLAGKDFMELQAESFRKMLLAVVKDLRVLVVKLADRLHNMRTLDVMRPEKQKRIAKETLEIYAELANRIGMNPVYQELQDLSFKYLHPRRYDVINRALTGWRHERGEMIEKVIRDFCLQLVAYNVEATVKGNEKNLYGIFKKMREQNLAFSQVMDMYGFVVLVNGVSDSYRTLGALHNLYKPKPGSFKDYIAIPKNNGFQSLQTTLISPFGLPIEVQIRTYEMDKLSETGRSNVKLFRLRKTTSENSADIRTKQWFETIKDFQEESDSAVEFYEDVKKDLFPDELYVFTPKGKIIVLPKKSTLVDFAYAIHTDIGHHCTGAKVNGISVPLRYQLQSGDIVDIKTNPKGSPNPLWLSFVVSGRARSAIRSKLKNMNREDAISLGEKLLQKVLVDILPEDVIFSECLKDKYIEYLRGKNMAFADILYEVGMGKTLPIKVAMDIAELVGRCKGQEVKLSPITIAGISSRKVSFANCCYPIPGDDMKAVLVRNEGLIVHRKECSNLQKYPTENQLDAIWEDLSTTKKFKVKIGIKAREAQGLLAQIVNCISSSQVNIEFIDMPSSEEGVYDGHIKFVFRLEIQEGLPVLSNVIKSIEKIPQVISVKRE